MENTVVGKTQVPRQRRREPYAEVGRAMRQAIDRALADPYLTFGEARVLLVVLAEVVSWSRLAEDVWRSEIARKAGVSDATIKRAMKRLDALGVVVWSPSKIRGHRSHVALPVAVPADQLGGHPGDPPTDLLGGHPDDPQDEKKNWTEKNPPSPPTERNDTRWGDYREPATVDQVLAELPIGPQQAATLRPVMVALVAGAMPVAALHALCSQRLGMARDPLRVISWRLNQVRGKDPQEVWVWMRQVVYRSRSVPPPVWAVGEESGRVSWPASVAS